MAVYTEVPTDEAAALMRALNLGELTALRGIQGGIENTNYFATTELDGVTTEHVLTVFERLSFEQLPYYLRLMKHLAGKGIPVPEPAANARGELLPSSGPVKIRIDGDPSAVTDMAARHLERDLNHYLTVTASEYYEDTDRMLLMVGFGGSAFKKVYNCPLRRRPVSESVDASDLIVSNTATDIKNAARVTHRVRMRQSVLKRMQIVGEYRDVELGEPIAMPNSVDRKVGEVQGTQPVAAPNLRPQQDEGKNSGRDGADENKVPRPGNAHGQGEAGKRHPARTAGRLRFGLHQAVEQPGQPH